MKTSINVVRTNTAVAESKYRFHTQHTCAYNCHSTMWRATSSSSWTKQKKSHNTKANDGGIKAHCAHLDSGSQPNESQTFNAKILDYQVSIPLYWILSSIFLCLRWLTRVLFCVLWGPRIKKAKNGKTAIKNQNKVISIRLDEDRKAFKLWQNVHIWFGFARTSIEHH